MRHVERLLDGYVHFIEIVSTRQLWSSNRVESLHLEKKINIRWPMTSQVPLSRWIQYSSSTMILQYSQATKASSVPPKQFLYRLLDVPKIIFCTLQAIVITYFPLWFPRWFPSRKLISILILILILLLMLILILILIPLGCMVLSNRPD